jgi:hypothetical protein
MEMRFDRFTGGTNLVYKGWPATLDSRRPIMILVAVLTPEEPAQLAMMGFRSTNSDWRYLQCNSLHAMADNVPVALGRPRHNGDVQPGYVFEDVSVEVDLDLLTKLSVATVVDVRLCSDEFKLNSIELNALRDVVAAMRAHNERL